MIDKSVVFLILAVVLAAPHLSEDIAIEKARLCAVLGVVFFIVGVINGTT